MYRKIIIFSHVCLLETSLRKRWEKTCSSRHIVQLFDKQREKEKRSNGILDMKLSAHLRTLASSWYGISGTPLGPIHLLAWLDMAARLDRFVGVIWLSRNLLSLDGYSPMSRNSFRMSSVIKMSPWNSSYPSNKREVGWNRISYSIEIDLWSIITTRCLILSSVVHYFSSLRWCWSIRQDDLFSSALFYKVCRLDLHLDLHLNRNSTAKNKGKKLTMK